MLVMITLARYRENVFGLTLLHDSTLRLVRSYDLSDVARSALDAIHSRFECCGVDEWHREWKDVVPFPPRTDGDTQEPWVPASCCIGILKIDPTCGFAKIRGPQTMAQLVRQEEYGLAQIWCHERGKMATQEWSDRMLQSDAWRNGYNLVHHGPPSTYHPKKQCLGWSQEACRLHRFAYSFGSTLSANLLLLAASDRFMCTYWPVKMLRFQRRHAYYAVIAVTVLSGVMMLPLGICVEWVTIGEKVWCWIDSKYSGLDVYHALFSNACVIQPLCTGVLNICFLVKIRQLLHKRAQLSSSIGSKDRRDLAASETLVVITLVTLCTALPQSAAYNAAFVLSRRPNTQEQTSLAFNISDIMWCVMLTQTACNIIVYLVRMSAFRKMSLSVIKCQGFRRRQVEGTNDQNKTF
ncbi:hypothetical protein X801_04342, partial [Opisthorchis viverrini]